ncbi:unnamed protein product [Peniophora sp. CBMAI 1063]|nr:unnamed protein product [Peniophora sp. CBMAI 1063]
MVSRRRSVSSSSSSSSSSSDSGKSGKSHKKDKKNKKHGNHSQSGLSGTALGSGAAYAASSHQGSSYGAPTMPMPGHGFPVPAHDIKGESAPPPAYSTRPDQMPPPSGYRIPLTTDGPFPDPTAARNAPFVDSDGRNPIFVGSALMGKSVHPCKISPMLNPPCRVPWGGGELEHKGRYDLLPFDPATMEWVRTGQGRIPPGRRPVEGGYEEDGHKLYHAAANMNGVVVPGKTAERLGGAHIPYGGGEHVIRDNYDILCWKF